MTLSGSDWTLSWRLQQDTGESTSFPGREGWESVSSTVPGSFELDFMRNGIEEDPFLDEHLYDYRKY